MKNKNDKYWSTKLDKFSYKILREAGTEMPFSGKYNMHFENGFYNAKDVEINYLRVILNLIVDVDGQVLINQLKVQLNTEMITHYKEKELK